MSAPDHCRETPTVRRKEWLGPAAWAFDFAPRRSPDAATAPRDQVGDGSARAKSRRLRG